MRFCSATSHTLTKLSRQIAAGIPGLQTAFDEHAELLNAAISELDNRYPDSHRDED